jgi:hypothetical protein
MNFEGNAELAHQSNSGITLKVHSRHESNLCGESIPF